MFDNDLNKIFAQFIFCLKKILINLFHWKNILKRVKIEKKNK